MKYKVITFLTLIVLFFSCKKDKVIPPPDLGYDYYPGTIKSYVIYDVDSIVYHALPQRDTVKYTFQIKEIMDTLITDNSNRPTIKIIRYKRNYNASVPYDSIPWTLQDVWVANKTSTDVEVVEENIRYTKLTFPVKITAQWNGTAAADSTANNYQYTNVDASQVYNGISFAKTLTVSQKNFPTAISNQNYYEQYARGVGLIYKQIYDVTYYQDNQGNVYPGQIYYGTDYKMTIHSYSSH